MNIKQISKKHFSILLASYTLIFIIPLIISFFTYLQVQRALQSEASRANSAVLELTRSYLDSQLLQVKQLEASIMLNTRINHFMSYQQLGINEHFLLHQIVRDMSSMRNQYPFISDFYIYFRNSNIVVTPSASYSSDMFFDYIYTENPHYLSHTSSLPFARQGDARAVLTIMLDTRNISKFLDNLQWMEGGMTYIVDEHNNLIATSNNALLPDPLPDFAEDGALWELMRINGEETLVSSVFSEEQSWQYVAMLPTRVFSYQVNHIRNFFVSMLFVSLAVGVVMIIALTYRNYAPVHSIVKRLPDLSLFEEQKPLVKNNLLMGLLSGNLTFSPGFVENLQVYGVEFPHDHFVVLTMIPVKEQAPDESLPEALLHYLEQCGGWDSARLYICNAMHKARFVMLCNIPGNWDEKPDDFESRLVEIQSFFASRQNYFIGVGSVYGGSGIAASYSESTISLDSLSGEAYIRRYSSIIESMNFHYPLETEQKLLNSLKSGNLEQCADVLEHIIAENVQKRELSANKRRALFLDIFNTVNRALGELKIFDPNLADSRIIETCNTFDEAKTVFHKCFSDICEHVSIRKKSRNIKLLMDVMAYLDATYSDSQCSLNAAAEELNVSVPYLSRFFKEQLGVNFNNYLNQLRIDEAQILLRRKIDEPIAGIAQAVGFNSDISFIRVFKKYTGKTPGNFRREVTEA